MKVRTLLLSIATLCAVAAGSAQAQLTNPFMWELSKGGKSVTLLGSLHLGKADFYPLPAAVMARFDAAKTLAVEADVTDPKAQEACAKLSSSSTPYEAALSADQKRLLANYIRLSNVDKSQLEGRKLWMVNLVLVVTELTQLGVDLTRGVDINLLNMAKDNDKKVVEIEGGERQCAALAAGTDAESAAALGRFLETIRDNRMESRVNNMMNAYRSGNDAVLLRGINEEYGDTPQGAAARKRVFEDRQPYMAQVIEGYLNEKAPSYFVVVGVGHMLGEQSLLTQLEKRGIKVQRLK